MKLLVFDPPAPPRSGQGSMMQFMLDCFGGDARQGGELKPEDSASGVTCYRVGGGSPRELEDTALVKAWRVLRYCAQAIWCRFRYGVRTLYYVPTLGRHGGLYRDWMVMLLCRPFFRNIVHHWEQIGLGDWLEAEGGAIERWVTHWLLGEPALGIAPSAPGMRDSLWFRSRTSEIVLPGIVDPCPDYARTIRPDRERRAAERRAWISGCNPDQPNSTDAEGCSEVRVLGFAEDDRGVEAIVQGLGLVLADLQARGLALRCRFRLLMPETPPDAAAKLRLEPPADTVIEPIGRDAWSSGAERAAVWRGSDCFLFASSGSDLPTMSMVLEAMAFGVPVVGNGRSAAADLLPADYAGLLHSQRPEEFMRAVLAAFTEIGTPLRDEFLVRHAPGPYTEQFRAALGRLSEASGIGALRRTPSKTAEVARAVQGTVTILQIFNRYLEVGGEEKSVERIAQDMAAGGNRVVRFLRESSEWHAPSAPPKWQHPFLLWRNPEILEELRVLHEASHADCWVVHNFLPVISLDLYHEAGRLGVPVIQFLHNYRPLSPSGSLFANRHRLQPEDRWIALKETLAGSWRGNRLLTAWLALGYWWIKVRGDLRRVNAWVAVSEEMRQVFLRAGWPAEKTFTLRHAWHTKTIELPGAVDEGYFLFLGRVVESKGVRFLIDLWRAPELAHLQLVIAGEGELVAELGACSPPNVRWIGFVDGTEKQQWLARCRAVLFPSLWDEPLSTVAYEAYEHRRPILASSQGGMKEIVFDHQTGRLLPPGDHAAWLEAIRTLDAETAARLGIEGRRWLVEHTGPEAWARQFNAILANVLPLRR